MHIIHNTTQMPFGCTHHFLCRVITHGIRFSNVNPVDSVSWLDHGRARRGAEEKTKTVLQPQGLMCFQPELSLNTRALLPCNELRTNGGKSNENGSTLCPLPYPQKLIFHISAKCQNSTALSKLYPQLTSGALANKHKSPSHSPSTSGNNFIIHHFNHIPLLYRSSISSLLPVNYSSSCNLSPVSIAIARHSWLRKNIYPWHSSEFNSAV